MKKTVNALCYCMTFIMIFTLLGCNKNSADHLSNIKDETVTEQSDQDESNTEDKTELTDEQEENIAPRISEEADYYRAFEENYISAEYESKSIDDTVFSSEYKALLSAMINRIAPDTMEYFNSKVSDYEVEMTRGMAAVMSWYAAVCLGIDDYNKGFDVGTDGKDTTFWDIDGGIYNELFPDSLKDSPVETGRENQVWSNEFTASMIWNVMHYSPVSSKLTIAWDYDEYTLHSTDPLTVEDAVCAITRLNDSYLDTISVPFNSEEASVISIDESLLTKAAKSTITSIDELPRLTGFVFAFTYDYENQGIVATERDIKNISDWGFTSARVPIKYEALFSEDCSGVNLLQMQRLDDLVEAAIQYNVHLNIVFTTLPGRTAWLGSDHEGAGDFDMFINPDKQAKAVKIWEYIADRYKDVPGEYVSFTPFWEATNKNLATGAPAPDYGEKEITAVLDKIIYSIRQIDEDRFIIYEPDSSNNYESIIRASKYCYDQISSKYDNVRISYNFCDGAFAFYNLIDPYVLEGINMDLVHYAMFAPEYPTIIYSARWRIDDGHDLIVDGFLPKGTTFDIYVRNQGGGGLFNISDDTKTIYEENLEDQKYGITNPMSHFFPYSTSEKVISFTLEENTDSLHFTCNNCYLEWCGLNVTLPEEYAVERYYSFNAQDREELGEEYGTGFALIKTSTIMIAPNSQVDGAHITICEDVTYKSETVYAKADSDNINEWGEIISDFSPDAILRLESVSPKGVREEDALEYYDDILNMCDNYNFGWYSKDYAYLIGIGETNFSEEERIEYAGYKSFEINLLETLQKHK